MEPSILKELEQNCKRYERLVAIAVLEYHREAFKQLLQSREQMISTLEELEKYFQEPKECWIREQISYSKKNLAMLENYTLKDVLQHRGQLVTSNVLSMITEYMEPQAGQIAAMYVEIQKAFEK